MSERPRMSDDRIAAAIREAFADECPPDGLEQRLARSLRTLPSPVRTTLVWRRFAMAVAAIILILALAVIPVSREKAELADVPLKELQAFIDANRPVDVATNDPARVRNWLAQRVDFAPPLVARGSTQIELIGGRLCVFAGRRVASYMYRVQGRLLSIYIMSADGLRPTGGIQIERAGRTLLFTREDRLTQASWIENRLIYSAAAELSEPALLAALDDLAL
jgi:anti-sigma factor RsiW